MTPTEPAAAGRALLELARAGRFAEIRDMFAPSLRPLVTPESVQVTWDAEVAKQGPVTAVGVPVSEPAGPGGTLVRVPVTFAHGRSTVLVTVTDTGWLTGIQIAAAEAAQPAQPWQPPRLRGPRRLPRAGGDGRRRSARRRRHAHPARRG